MNTSFAPWAGARQPAARVHPRVRPGPRPNGGGRAYTVRALVQCCLAAATLAVAHGQTPAARRAAPKDSAQRTERLVGFLVTRPAKAGYLALVPGLGQAYNRQWWKLPLVYGALGATTGLLIYQQRGLNEFAAAANRLAADPAVRAAPLPNPSLGPNAGQLASAEAIQNRLLAFRHYRDAFILYTAAAYGLQALDAIVGAHLRAFEVGDDLTLQCQPAWLMLPSAAPGLPLVLGGRITLQLKEVHRPPRVLSDDR